MMKQIVLPVFVLAACTTPNPDYRPPKDGSVDPPDGSSMKPDPSAPACSQIQVSTLSGTGAAGFVDGPGAMAQFDGPEGITVANDGTLFVADYNNECIRKVLSDGKTSTYAPSTALASAYRLAYYLGDLFLIDRRNDALLRISSGPPPIGYIIHQVGELNTVGIGPNGIYVARSSDCRIKRFDEGTMTATPIAGGVDCGFADGPAGVARFSVVEDIKFDGPEKMLVVDPRNYRIRIVNEIAGTVTTLAGSTMGYADGKGTEAKFENPTGIAVDPQTHIVYVADKTRIRAITPQGDVTTLVGGPAGFDDGSGCTAKFGELRGIAYYAGALYAVDVNRVRKVKLY